MKFSFTEHDPWGWVYASRHRPDRAIWPEEWFVDQDGIRRYVVVEKSPPNGQYGRRGHIWGSYEVIID